MTTTLTAAAPSAQPINQGAVDYEELARLESEAWNLKHVELEIANKKAAAAREKWSQAIKQAVLCASELIEPQCEGNEAYPGWLHNEIGKAVSGDSTDAGGEEDEVPLAFGFGMVCGMMYAQLTGMKLPIPELPAKEKAAPNAPAVA
jgi:hypothetical protein